MGENTKMSWYKQAKNFDYRNIINHKIMYLEEVKNILKKISKLIFQSASMAKQSNVNIIKSKKITSYPSLHNILIEADSIALDSPWKFAALCEEAVVAINYQIEELKIERREITEGKKDKKVQKGWVLDE
jgi:hypothetical protein